MWEKAASLIDRAGTGGRGAVLAVALAVAGCSGVPDDMRLTDRGAGAFAAGDYESAEAHLREALEINPDNGYALLGLGAVYERTDRGAEARMVYAETLARYASDEFSAMGVKATEREALAALARENLARLKDDPDGRRGAMATNETIKAVFGDLQDVTENLNKVSRDLFGNFKKISDNLEAISRSVRGVAAKPAASGSASATTGGTAASSRTSQAQNGAEVSSLGPGIKVHLASYRSLKRGKQGWEKVRTAHNGLLGQLGHGLVRVDLGAGMGVFYRLLAGPLDSESAARQVCSSLKTKGEFCELVFD